MPRTKLFGRLIAGLAVLGLLLFGVVSCGSTVEPGNGPGGLWNIPASEWLAKSALGSVTGSADTSKITGPSSNLPSATA
jgi:hypothetical protein